jgi:VacB/RNase II family 3'-5' exoribonuclease
MDLHMGQHSHREILQQVAVKAMIDRGLEPDFPANVLEELNCIGAPASDEPALIKNMTSLPWCSIDNEDSLDLDQLTYAEKLPGNRVKVLVAVADVDALVNAQSHIDQHAGQNTTSVYTVARIFPMLPERLSTDLTSLAYNTDRRAIVIEMTVDEDGTVQQSDVYCAMVRNQAKLEYGSLAAWLEGTGPVPPGVNEIPGLADTIRLQDQVAQKMRALRHEHGALDFETIETVIVFTGDDLAETKGEKKNRAQNMIEDFMIASNGITARYLAQKNSPSLRRVVRTPKRWDRIVEMAAEHDFSLPEEADSKALSQYLAFVKQKFPQQYGDLSLSVLKLLGSGEYIVQAPGEAPQGHFGLAVKDYAHSTAPNRRYPDLITHRLLKSAMNGGTIPYPMEQLETIARHCTLKEDDARKVERQVEKTAQAIIMESRIGEEFDAIISGAAPKGTWIRILNPHLEGKLVKGCDGLKVGQQLKVRLIGVDVEAGFIDFEKADWN